MMGPEKLYNEEEDSRRPPHSPAFRLEESGVVRLGSEKLYNEGEDSRRPPHSPAFRLEESGVVGLGPEKRCNEEEESRRPPSLPRLWTRRVRSGEAGSREAVQRGGGLKETPLTPPL